MSHFFYLTFINKLAWRGVRIVDVKIVLTNNTISTAKGAPKKMKTMTCSAGRTVEKADNITIPTSVEERRKLLVAKEPDFHWEYNEEPHMTRRIQIATAYPEIKKLFGYDSMIKYKVLMAHIIHYASLHLLQGASWYTWVFCAVTLCGTLNSMISMALHEISHNLGAKKILHNRILALLASKPLAVPVAFSFKRYHMEHHRYQGEDVIDVDLPTNFEGFFFRSSPRKVLWLVLQPAFYALRPLVVNPKDPSKWEIIDCVCTILYDLLIIHIFGIGGLLYLFAGMVSSFTINPCAGHLVSEHCVMREGQETYSYYGPLNWFTFNVGYHNEHHDFPFVPGHKLHEVRKIAPEFYDYIPHYHSWIKVMYDFVTDSRITPHSRTKRVTLEKKEFDHLRSSGGLVK